MVKSSLIRLTFYAHLKNVNSVIKGMITTFAILCQMSNWLSSYEEVGYHPYQFLWGRLTTRTSKFIWVNNIGNRFPLCDHGHFVKKKKEMYDHTPYPRGGVSRQNHWVRGGYPAIEIHVKSDRIQNRFLVWSWNLLCMLKTPFPFLSQKSGEIPIFS